MYQTFLNRSQRLPKTSFLQSELEFRLKYCDRRLGKEWLKYLDYASLRKNKTEKVQSKTARQVCDWENLLAINKHV